jgi:dihydrofolate synthase/folylpolyglutamate synthase
LHDAGESECAITRRELSGYVFDATVCGVEYKDVEISMIGAHQVRNALTALAAIEVLRMRSEIKTDGLAVRRGLKNAVQAGRFEIMGANPYVILDGAHNEKGVDALVDTMRGHFAGKRVLAVVGVLSDKDTARLAAGFLAIADDFIATEPQNPRKLAAEKLSDLLRRVGGGQISTVPVETVSDPVDAFRLAMERKDEFDVILFAGSLYLIGQIRGMFHGESQS